MRSYTRLYAPGACYFFTVNLRRRHGTNLLTRYIDVLRASFQSVQSDHPFTLQAIVILPDHLHALWRLPDGDADFSTRWRLIKTRFSRNVGHGERITQSRARRGERGVWQRRFWEHLIRDERDWQQHVDYIHYNPVKHGFVARPIDWPYSSLHRFVRDRCYEPDWAAAEPVCSMDLE